MEQHNRAAYRLRDDVSIADGGHCNEGEPHAVRDGRDVLLPSEVVQQRREDYHQEHQQHEDKQQLAKATPECEVNQAEPRHFGHGPQQAEDSQQLQHIYGCEPRTSGVRRQRSLCQGLGHAGEDGQAVSQVDRVQKKAPEVRTGNYPEEVVQVKAAGTHVFQNKNGFVMVIFIILNGFGGYDEERRQNKDAQ